MSKKHFQKLAYELFQVRPAQDAPAYQGWFVAMLAVADASAQCNPAFDRGRFMDACLADSYSPGMHGR